MKILLVTFPSDDEAFRAHAQKLLASAGSAAARLQDRLRDSFPNALVVQGIRDTNVERWYAYRDGHWVRPGGSG